MGVVRRNGVQRLSLIETLPMVLVFGAIGAYFGGGSGFFLGITGGYVLIVIIYLLWFNFVRVDDSEDE